MARARRFIFWGVLLLTGLALLGIDGHPAWFAVPPVLAVLYTIALLRWPQLGEPEEPAPPPPAPESHRQQDTTTLIGCGLLAWIVIASVLLAPWLNWVIMATLVATPVAIWFIAGRKHT